MVRDNLVIENANIGFKNFSGKEGRFNNPGNRNFCVFFDDLEMANQLEEDGWNIRWLEPRDPDAERRAYLQVAVSYDNFPPNIYLVTSRSKTRLDEKEVNILDWAEIKNVDLVIRPYNWTVGGRSGVKGYVKSMHVTIEEDPFAYKYVDIPDSAQSAMMDNPYGSY